jgi:hypothetical protein
MDTPVPVTIEGPLEEDRWCLSCGYNLRGLDAAEGACPECGTPVWRSLQGNLLKFSSPDYLRALHLGVFIILVAILVRIGGMLVGGIGLAGLSAVTAQDGRWLGLVEAVNAAIGLADMALALALIWGWWLFSSPDPAVLGNETGDTPRRVLRAAAIVLGVTELVGGGAEIAGVGSIALSPAVQGTIAIFGIVALAAWIVKFFAAMLYLRWLAPRLPNRQVDERAKMLMWLGPLLLVFGCLVIPYIVALVLYLNLLNWVRIDIGRIRTESRHLATS